MKKQKNDTYQSINELIDSIALKKCPAGPEHIEKLRKLFDLPEDATYQQISAHAIWYGGILAAMNGNPAPAIDLIKHKQIESGGGPGSGPAGRLAQTATKLPAISAQKQKRQIAIFLSELERTGFVTRACKAAGIPRRCLYEWQERDEQFAEAWERAQAKGREWHKATVEASFYRRGIQGIREPLIQGGKQARDAAGRPVFRRVFDTTAGIFFAKSVDPKYRDTDPQAGKGQIDIALQWQVFTPSGETVTGGVRVSA